MDRTQDTATATDPRPDGPRFRTVEGVQVTRDYIGGGNRVLITRKHRVFVTGSEFKPGNSVTAYVDGDQIESETVLCREVWEPETLNRIGQPGAYVFHLDRERLRAIALRMALEHGLPIQDNAGAFDE